ncbi:MAG: hypothetical protein IJ057_00570 [Bacteroidales bacterium]|nr:hypothetical protein [Bacteroidales bacterium]
MDNNNDFSIRQTTDVQPLVADLRQIITTTRSRVATNVNAELTLMYWQIGERINREVLGNKRAEYGDCVAGGDTIAARLWRQGL